MSNEENKLDTELSNQNNNSVKRGVFSNISDFENAQRMAVALSKSDIVPKAYQGNLSNCLVAIEMSNRMKISPLMVMQNLDIIHGKPSWRSSFIISALNSSGNFSPLRFRFTGEKGTTDYGCTAYATDLQTMEIVEGPKVDWKMVTAEGWLNKSGSKWKTMPQLMFHYRAAAFFGRIYAPEILTGMHTAEENTDVYSQKNTQQVIDDKLFLLNELFEEKKDLIGVEDMKHLKRVIDNKEVMTYDKAISVLKKL